jgi:hypothetical protein
VGLNHSLREEGVEGGGTGLFSTSRPWCRQLSCCSFCRSLYALALMFPPTLSSHQRTLSDAHAPVGVCVVNDRRRWCRSRVELLSCGVLEETKQRLAHTSAP